jgi:diacylglycerol kinase (ATP)
VKWKELFVKPSSQHPQWLSPLFQDLGVTKVGHMKRILCGIKELSRSSPAAEA